MPGRATGLCREAVTGDEEWIRTPFAYFRTQDLRDCRLLCSRSRGAPDRRTDRGKPQRCQATCPGPCERLFGPRRSSPWRPVGRVNPKTTGEVPGDVHPAVAPATHPVSLWPSRKRPPSCPAGQARRPGTSGMARFEYIDSVRDPPAMVALTLGPRAVKLDGRAVRRQ